MNQFSINPYINDDSKKLNNILNNQVAPFQNDQDGHFNIFKNSSKKLIRGKKDAVHSNKKDNILSLLNQNKQGKNNQNLNQSNENLLDKR